MFKVDKQFLFLS